MGLNLNSIYQRPYLVKDNRTLVKKKQDEDASRSAAQEAQREEQANQNARSKGLQYIENNQNGFTRTTSQIQAQPWQKELYQNAQTQQTQAVTPQALSGRSSSINIAQILKDFKNPAVAIGTPDELNEEVDSYLQLIQKQVSKQNAQLLFEIIHEERIEDEQA